MKFPPNIDNFLKYALKIGYIALKNSLPPRAAARGGRNFRGGVAPLAPPLYPPLGCEYISPYKFNLHVESIIHEPKKERKG